MYDVRLSFVPEYRQSSLFGSDHISHVFCQSLGFSLGATVPYGNATYTCKQGSIT